MRTLNHHELNTISGGTFLYNNPYLIGALLGSACEGAIFRQTPYVGILVAVSFIGEFIYEKYYLPKLEQTNATSG